MNIQKLNENEFSHEYGILCKRIAAWENVPDPPFGSSYCVIKPGHSSEPHNHHEGELFYILDGCGVIEVDDEIAEVESGDVIYLNAFSTHSLRNNTNHKDLTFLAVWWEDSKLLEEALDTGSHNYAHKTLITAPPPTPNGDLHLGHLSGPYLGADIYNRFLKLQDLMSHYISGTDDFQSYVPLKADQLKRSPKEVADSFGKVIEDTFSLASIKMDHLYRPNHSVEYLDFIQQFFMKLYNQGKLIEKEVPSLFCEYCDCYLYGAHVKGKCPHCLESSDGNGCEKCGQPNDCTDMLDVKCKQCDHIPSIKMTKHLYFPLQNYNNQLREYYKKVTMGSHLRSLCEKLLSDGLPDIRITHISDWGIPVPLDTYNDQILYVWFEMAPGYLAATDQCLKQYETNDSWKTIWKNDQSKNIQFFGFDNGFYYAVLIPALHMAFDSDMDLPDVFVTNEFLQLDNLKFSTSRGHAIWGQDIFRKIPTDQVRFFLSYIRPENRQTNFSLSEFEHTNEQVLMNEWQNWLQHLLDKVNHRYDGVTPHVGNWSDRHLSFYEMIKTTVTEVTKAYEADSFSPQQVTRLLNEFVRKSSAFGESEQYLGDITSLIDDYQTSISLELTSAKQLAILVAPIMPQFSQLLWKCLGINEPIKWEYNPIIIEGNLRISSSQDTFFLPIKECLRELEVK
ncbi:class I tRNA ligase family protein [Cytobacillus sp. IB215316]|uniref:class I tRNA ligase family protein n=1 Tax=Cytobacillus sp. IB215316 TaxID=3097354 RepID=UPI002A161597|nr:class I tRNA ligase family protein [Cytobacillus sp. IB215316]MDX8360982.1 class I tRNA ligase family protein [Cytobacillus sp. IB215316]